MWRRESQVRIHRYGFKNVGLQPPKLPKMVTAELLPWSTLVFSYILHLCFVSVTRSPNPSNGSPHSSHGSRDPLTRQPQTFVKNSFKFPSVTAQSVICESWRKAVCSDSVLSPMRPMVTQFPDSEDGHEVRSPCQWMVCCTATGQLPQLLACPLASSRCRSNCSSNRGTRAGGGRDGRIPVSVKTAAL